MKLKWFIATFRDTTTNKWREVNIQADSLREARYKAITYHKGTFARYKAITYHKGTFEVLERIEEK